jgi:hypothetical protein
MIRVTMWKTNDGVLYPRRAEAAHHERERRKADQRAVKQFLFKCWADDPEFRRGRLPAGAWCDDGMWLYVWSCTAGTEAAIRRAARRCQSLRQRTGMPWDIDYEMQFGTGTNQDSICLDRHPLLVEQQLVS